MPITVITFEELKEQQGSEPLFLNGRYLFESGAQSDGQYTHYLPPGDSAALMLLQNEFFTTKLEQVRATYTADRNAIAEQVRFYKLGVGPLPAPGWKEHLQRLSSEIQELEARLQTFRGQMVGERVRDNHFEAEAMRHKQANEVLAGLSVLPSYSSASDDLLDR